MDRRAFIGAIGGAALIGVPGLARAQAAGKVWRIGFLGQGAASPSYEAFREGLRSFGYIEGTNSLLEARWADGREGRLAELAAELVQLKVDVIVAQASVPVAAAKRATGSIPIVMAAAGDPVGTGLVASLARPGGNVTGMSSQSPEFAGKRLQMLREIVPGATRVAVLVFKGGVVTPITRVEIAAAARKMGMTLFVQEANEAEALAGQFSAMRRERSQVLLVQLSPFSTDHRKRIAELALQHRLPSMYDNRNYVDAGGLISYGPSQRESYRRAAYFVDRILKGAKPADLPVEQATKVEMFINLKTAKALGIKVPQAVLARADEVIQ